LFENGTVVLKTENDEIIWVYGYRDEYLGIVTDMPEPDIPERVNLTVRISDEGYEIIRQDLISIMEYEEDQDEIEDIKTDNNINIFWRFYRSFIHLLDTEVVVTLIE
jgi:hypothetical protein